MNKEATIRYTMLFRSACARHCAVNISLVDRGVEEGNRGAHE